MIKWFSDSYTDLFNERYQSWPKDSLILSTDSLNDKEVNLYHAQNIRWFKIGLFEW